MGWALFQAVIIFAVVSSNIHWKWTPNGYLASTIGILCAWGITWVIFLLRSHRLPGGLLREHKRANQSKSPIIRGNARRISRIDSM